MKIMIETTQSEARAIERYRLVRNLTKKGAVKRLTLDGLIRAGALKQTAMHKELGIGEANQ